MKKKLTLLVGLILLLVVSGYISTLTTNIDWLTFENTRYNYQFKHPKEVTIDTGRMAGSINLPEEFNVYVFIPGKMRLFEVFTEYVATSSAPLSEYANAVWKRQLENDAKPQVGGLKEILVDGKPAYSFTLTKSFTTEYGGYLLPSGDVYNYILIKNNQGYFMTIHYPISSKDHPELARISKQIFNSFQFE